MLEAKFYLLVGVLILARQEKRMDVVFPIWAIAVALLLFVLPSLSHSTDYLGNFYLLLAAGAILASVQLKGWTRLRTAGRIATITAVVPFELARAD